MNKLKDIISPGHRELDEILYNSPKKASSPHQASPKRSLSQRVRSVRHKDKNGSPDSTANGSTTNPSIANNAAPPLPPPAQAQAQQQQYPMPAEEYAVPEDAVSRTEQIYSPQPIYPPRRLDTPKHLATPEEELEEGQFGQVSSGRPTYLVATNQVPSEIASVASIKSGAVGYPADATSVSREATPRGFAGDGDYVAQPQTNNASSYTQDRNWAPAGVAAGVGAAGVGAAAYSHHQRHDRDNIHNQDSYDSSRNAPMTAATYSPVDHSDDFTHPYNPAVNDVPTPTETASWERPSLMPGTYVSENDIKHSGSTSHTTGPHKSKIANFLDPRVKRDKEAQKSTHEADAPNQFDQKIDSNPAPVYSDRQAPPQGHHGKGVAMAAGAAGLAGAGAHHASQNSRANEHRDGYERQTSPYSSAPLDPRVDTAGRASNPHNTVAAPAYNRDVSPMASPFNTADTSAAYGSSNTHQPPFDVSSVSPISPMSQQGQMVQGPHDPTVTAGHSRFDSVQEGPYPDKDAEMAALGGVDAGRRYSRSSVERADKEYREEYQLYQKELARDQAAEEKELESERRMHEKQLSKEQKQIDKDLAKSQKEHTKQMQKEARQIQKEIERQENGGKKKRRSGLFGFLHKDKHAHEHDTATSSDAYGSSSEEVRHSGDSSRQERHRLAKSPPAGYN